jgi:hypothetical protein
MTAKEAAAKHQLHLQNGDSSVAITNMNSKTLKEYALAQFLSKNSPQSYISCWK